MTVDEFYNQEHCEKPYEESIFHGVKQVTLSWRGEIEDDSFFSEYELKAFAEAYHQMKIKE